MVSVIIPVYNGEEYIQTILNSFMRQKDNDFEIIFVNDGSTDDSFNKLNSAKDNSNLSIIVIDQQNAGVSAARNAGIKNARGGLLCFCDVDDDVTDGYISDMRYVIENNDVELVICKHKLLQVDGTEVSNSIDQGTGKVIIKDSISCLRDYLYGRMVSGCWTLMVRKELLTKNDLWFAEGYKYSEDLHMVWRLLACSRNVAYLDKALYIYFLRKNSATSKFDIERLHGHELMKSLGNFMDKYSPQFTHEYKKYAASKMMWSITWQSSILFEFKKFKAFIQKYNVKKDMRNLLTFRNRKIALSSAMFLLSPNIFRKMAIRYGKKLTH